MRGQDTTKVPIPEGKQVIGIIEELVGWAHAKVRCFDGKTRICRVPKKLSRRIWLRRGDYVLVDPWEISGDKKGDIIYIYSPTEIEWLQKHGYIKLEEEEF
ncbi:MAG TPA: translation initiation factor IF-1A [Candidatus Nanopusillus sp.]|nr:translation initiation factor IF-1A [Candidatus Nanopusillus sp.]HIP90633.1 translation initiation factor IF-1A [Candidatus Nanopusillus sp.]